MIDSSNRRKAAQLLQEFLRGELSGGSVFENWPTGTDAEAILEIGYNLVLDDVERIGTFSQSEHAEMVPLIDRCVRFLEQDLPYEWPLYCTWRRILFNWHLLIPFLIVLAAAGMGLLISRSLPVSTTTGGFICGAVAVVFGIAMFGFVLPRIYEWRMRRELTAEEKLWPFRNKRRVGCVPAHTILSEERKSI